LTISDTSQAFLASLDDEMLLYYQHAILGGEAEAVSRGLVSPATPANDFPKPSAMYDNKPFAAPAEERCLLYRHFDEADTLLYIGISDNLARRGGEHAQSSAWVAFAHHATATWMDDRGVAATAEIAAIRNEKPIFNRTHNVGPDAERRRTDYLTRRGRTDLISETATPLTANPFTAKPFGASNSPMHYRSECTACDTPRLHCASKIGRHASHVLTLHCCPDGHQWWCLWDAESINRLCHGCPCWLCSDF
jgi:predicted GIY-YIG superfamily endonuclease